MILPFLCGWFPHACTAAVLSENSTTTESLLVALAFYCPQGPLGFAEGVLAKQLL